MHGTMGLINHAEAFSFASDIRVNSRYSRKVLWLLTVALLLGSTCVAHAAEPAYLAEQTPPQVVRRTYDPLNPPAEMQRKLTLPEAGLCEFKFGCEIRTGTATPLFGLQTVEATVTSVHLVTHLDITIWTVTASNAKLRAHEEGHREICEEYYRDAGQIALRLAGQALGTKLTIALKNRDTATKEAVDAFQDKLLQEFLNETGIRCTVAQENFDRITAHGVRPVTEAAAITQALTEERARDSR